MVLKNNMTAEKIHNKLLGSGCCTEEFINECRIAIEAQRLSVSRRIDPEASLALLRRYVGWAKENGSLLMLDEVENALSIALGKTSVDELLALAPDDFVDHVHTAAYYDLSQVLEKLEKEMQESGTRA